MGRREVYTHKLGPPSGLGVKALRRRAARLCISYLDLTMTVELQMLTWAVLIGLLHIVLQALGAAAQNGLGYQLGARDENRSAAGMSGRLKRALANFLETFPLFAAAVLVVTAADAATATTALGAQLYVVSRAAYIPLYACAVPVLRSAAWFGALIGLILVALPLMQALI